MTCQFDVATGERIRTRRERLGINKALLVRCIRTHRPGTTVYYERHKLIERGKRAMYASELADYCRALKCPPWWLLGMTREEAQVLDEMFGDE